VAQDIREKPSKAIPPSDLALYNTRAHNHLKSETMRELSFNRKQNARTKYLLKVRKSQFEFQISVHQFYKEIDTYLSQAQSVIGEK
jgi:hypothetical protein